MVKNMSAPVLISFKQINMFDKITLPHQTSVDVLYCKSNLPKRSFSLCSLLPGHNQQRKKRKNAIKEKEIEEKKVKNAEREIDRFEKDFVLPLWENIESDKKLSDMDTCDGIFSQNNKEKIFHSSSDSIQTDTDSGAFSRLSSPDRDSEYSDVSDSSMSVKNKIQEQSDSYSDEDIDEGLQKDNKISSQTLTSLQINCSSSVMESKKFEFASSFSQPSVSLAVHKKRDCQGIVTVNGLCYHCV
jgi:hypothetical protein